MTTALFERRFPSKPQYSIIRENTENLDTKRWLESLWTRYKPFCGNSDKFITDFCSDFAGLSWEMFIACHLLDIGKDLEKPASSGPDIKLITSSRVIWVEATAPWPGNGPDAAIPPPGNSYWIDENRIMLRHTNALSSKLEQWKNALSRGDVGKDDPYVIALCDGSIPDAGAHNRLPPIVRSAYGIDKPHYFLTPDQNNNSTQITDVCLTSCDSIPKGSGKFVDIGIFKRREYAAISGILYSPYLPWTAYQRSSRFFLYIENPVADNPVPRDTFSATMNYWFESNSVCWGKLG